jgi:hypothetical protein
VWELVPSATISVSLACFADATFVIAVDYKPKVQSSQSQSYENGSVQ